MVEAQRTSPEGSSAGGPTRVELFELYRHALDEYRFQVNLNWNRTQYYLALNVGVLGIATGILQLGNEDGIRILIAGLYFVGAVCCGLSLAATRVQKGYYAATRDHKADLEARLGLDALSISTTPGMGNTTIRRLGRVTTLVNVLLATIGIADLVGVVVALTR